MVKVCIEVVFSHALKINSTMPTRRAFAVCKQP